MSAKKPIYLTPQGVFSQLPTGSIINAGGVENTSNTFTVNGVGLLFESGDSTSGGGGITLQKVYNKSSPASIKLATGKDLTIYDDDDNTLYFRIDAETGKVTITGDLEVLGNSSTVNTVVTDADHWLISPASGFTSAIAIEPDSAAGAFQVDILTIRKIHGGTPVLKIDKDGNIILTGLVDGVDVSQLNTNFVNHTTLSSTSKHAASEVSVVGPFTKIGAPPNVEQALVALDALASSSIGGVFFIDAVPTSTGQVGLKQYVPGTVPANKVISQATTDTDNVTVTLLVEGNSISYSPTITVTTVPPQVGGPITATLVEDTYDKRTWIATAQLTGITANTVVNAASSTGAGTTMQLIRAPAGPAFTALTIGPYPGTQTAVKAGDLLTVTGTVENSATTAELLAFGACATLVTLTLGAPDSGGLGYKTVTGTFTVSGLSGNQAVKAQAKNAFNTPGAIFTSTNTVLLDQLAPTIGPITITYPSGQQALKGAESATVSATITDFDTVTYSGVNLSVSAPTIYAATKTVTRTGGTYVVGVNNYTITATRAANGATTTASAAISIADVPPTATISIVGSPARLRSSPSGIDYTVTVTADQQLLTAPGLSASSGTFQGTWAGTGTTWSRALRILDSDTKGPQTFSSLAVTGLAGLVGTTITSGASYIVGGFQARTITFPPFARYAPIGTVVTDFNKTVAAYTGSSVLTRFNNTGDHFQGFTIVNSGGTFNPTGDHLFISDAAFAGANTSGTLQLDIEEVV
jgi:hypothetical protein